MSLTLDNQSELNEGRAALFNAGSTSGWILLNYVGPSTVHFALGGEGTSDEMRGNLESNQIQYGLVRMYEMNKGTLTMVARDYFITWIGPEVSSAERTAKAAFLADAQSLLSPYYSAVTVYNRDHFNDENIRDKGHPLSTSHDIT